jgi:hypothetical protein
MNELIIRLKKERHQVHKGPNDDLVIEIRALLL